jgi:hypothetical protein
MSDNHRPMSFEHIQDMREAIDMVMRMTNDAKSRSYVAGVVTALAIEHDTDASTLANLALQRMGFPIACEIADNGAKLRSSEAQRDDR